MSRGLQIESTRTTAEDGAAGLESPARVDAIILAGTHGNAPFCIEDQDRFKPFLLLGGKTLVCSVTECVLGSERVGRVYVVGNVPLLEHALAPLMEAFRGRLRVVAEGVDILENCYRAFFLHLLADRTGVAAEALGAAPAFDPLAVAICQKNHPELADLPALILTCDLPFLTPEAVTRFLADAPTHAALCMGVVDHHKLEQLTSLFDKGDFLERWKLGALHLDNLSIRLANMFLVRPLRAKSVLYSLLSRVYAHRYLLRQDGSLQWANWWIIAASAVWYSMRVGGVLRFLRAFINFVPAVLAVGLARLTHRLSPHLSWPFRKLLGHRDMEFVCSLLVGVPAVLVVGEDPGPAIDIDLEEVYLSLARDDEQDYRCIKGFLGKWNRVRNGEFRELKAPGSQAARGR